MGQIEVTNGVPFLLLESDSDFFPILNPLDDISQCIRKIELENLGKSPMLIIGMGKEGFYHIYPFQCSIRTVQNEPEKPPIDIYDLHEFLKSRGAPVKVFRDMPTSLYKVLTGEYFARKVA